MMECPETRLLLAFRRPGGQAELAPEEAVALDRHLAECPDCEAAARRQAGLDSVLGQAMRSVAIPATLHSRLIADALAHRGAIWRQTVYQYATAASILVMFGLALTGFWFALRTTFDPELVADTYAQSVEDPDRAVRQWLASEGLPTTLPYNFDFRHRPGYGKETIQGQDVPVVRFELPPQPGGHRPEELRVYIVRASQFKLDQKTFQPTVNSFCTIQVVQDDGRGVAYVILYTTPTLDPFLIPAPQTT